MKWRVFISDYQPTTSQPWCGLSNHCTPKWWESESSCVWPGSAQVWARLVTLLSRAARHAGCLSPVRGEQSSGEDVGDALPPVTSHSDNRGSQLRQETPTQKWVSQWSSVCHLIIPRILRSKAGLKISDREEIFIVNLTNFSSIDQIGSPVITFFRPLILWHLPETRWIFPKFISGLTFSCF